MCGDVCACVNEREGVCVCVLGCCSHQMSSLCFVTGLSANLELTNIVGLVTGKPQGSAHVLGLLMLTTETPACMWVRGGPNSGPRAQVTNTLLTESSQLLVVNTISGQSFLRKG